MQHKVSELPLGKLQEEGLDYQVTRSKRVVKETLRVQPVPIKRECEDCD